MRLSKEFLLEFDPNRGAAGRSVPLVYASGKAGTSRQKAQNLGLRTQGKKDRRFASLGLETKDKLRAFEQGKNFGRFRGSSLFGYPMSDDERAHEKTVERIHQAGSDVARLPEMEKEREGVYDAQWHGKAAAEKGSKRYLPR